MANRGYIPETTGLRQAVRVEADATTSVVSGAENIRVFSRLTLETATLMGNLNGTLSGDGHYVRLAPENESAELVPNETSIRLQGVYTAVGDEKSASPTARSASERPAG